MKKLIIILFLFITPIVAQSAWQVVAWNVIKEVAIDTAIDAVQDLFKEQITPEEIAAIHKRVADLEKQLITAEQQKTYPSIAEFNAVKKLVANINNIVNKLEKRLSAVENRLDKVEQDVAAMRTTLLNIQKNDSITSIQATPTETLDFSINYVYRSAGKGAFKPLNDGDSLQSGDYYKIIFTPTEDCYVYIFQVDSANQLFRLFPMESFGSVVVNNFNSVKAGETYYIPAQDKSFELDEQIGTEAIYFIASKQLDAILETQYNALLVAQKNNSTIWAEQLQTQMVSLVAWNSKGVSAIKQDEIKTTSWKENNQTFSVLQQNLENMCNGCADILTFEHRE